MALVIPLPWASTPGTSLLVSERKEIAGVVVVVVVIVCCLSM